MPRLSAVSWSGVRAALPRGRTLPLAEFERRHRAILVLVVCQVPLLAAVGLVRGVSAAAVAEDLAAILVLAAVASRSHLPSRLRASLTSTGLVTSSAALVHLSGGAIEAHFHFFVAMVVLTLFEDWIPFLLSLGYVVFHHLILGMLVPSAVFAHGGDALWWTAVHGAFVFAAGIAAITGWRLNEDVRLEMQRAAHHDALTGLPNRTLFADRLEQALEVAREGGEQLAVLFLDVDRFKHINDTLGHATGDRLLREVAARLRACVHASDTLARMGGDEFTLLAVRRAAVDDVAALAERLLAALEAPVVVDGAQLFVSGSIGASVFPHDGDDAETLVKHAELAMYRAKERGSGHVEMYSKSLNARAEEQLVLGSSLRGALERDELFLAYQPQVDGRTGRIVGVEALLRWHNDELGLVAPGRFIGLAEETGLIVPMGEWVLRTAARQARAWHDAGHRLRVSVNISPRQLAQENLPDRVTAILDECGLDARWLNLEITESALLGDPAAAVRALERLRDRGVRLELDDFGTGYSSLWALRSLPLAVLKIDRSFVADIGDHPSNGAVVRSIVELAHALDLRVVGEGVETRDQHDALVTLGCDVFQGYLYSRPVAAAEIAALLERDAAALDERAA